MGETLEAIYESGVFKPLQPVELPERARVTLIITPQTEHSEKKPLKLYGDWRGKFPENFDVDAALKEIRSEWLKELKELDE